MLQFIVYLNQPESCGLALIRIIFLISFSTYSHSHSKLLLMELSMAGVKFISAIPKLCISHKFVFHFMIFFFLTLSPELMQIEIRFKWYQLSDYQNNGIEILYYCHRTQTTKGVSQFSAILITIDYVIILVVFL